MNDSINSNNKENYDKYVVDSSPVLGEGRVESVDRDYGQEQFGVIGKYVEPINCDLTRQTENDKIAYDLITKGAGGMVDDTEGGKY